MRIVHRLFERRDDSGAAIGRGKDRRAIRPTIRRRDQLCNRVTRRLGSRMSSTNSAAKANRRGEAQPRISARWRRRRPCCHPWRDRADSAAIRRRAIASRRALEIGRSPAPSASAYQAKVNIASVIAISMRQPCPLWSRARSASKMLITAGKLPPAISAASIGGTTGRVDRAGLQIQQAGIADVIDVVAGLVGARAALAVAGNRTIDQLRD